MADLAIRLTVDDVRPCLTVGQSGRLTWTTAAGVVGEVAYAVVGPADPLPAVALRYAMPDGRRVATTVRLTTSRTRFGGRRAWFLCPHVRDGKTCGRRVGTLYQPPSEPHFACRECHKLTYYMSRRAHQVERFLRRLAGRDLPDFLAGPIDWLRGEEEARGDRVLAKRRKKNEEAGRRRKQR